MKDLFTLENKIALVTGGSMGIGSMIAEGFLNFGAKVYIISRRMEILKKNRMSFQSQDHVNIFKPIWEPYQVLKNQLKNLIKKSKIRNIS